MAEKIRIGALISGGGTNLQAIIDACESGKIDGEMIFVGSDRPGAGGLKRAEHHGISTFVVDYKKLLREMQKQWTQISKLSELPYGVFVDEVFKKCKVLPYQFSNPAKARLWLRKRMAVEFKLFTEIVKYPLDLLILAGFMRNLTPYFIDQINTNPAKPRIMNIHPALSPAFPGTDGYGDTFRYGCKVGGCTVHFVDYGEDSGPIIGQRAYDIKPGDTLDDIKKRGLELEWQLFPECIQLFAENRLRVIKNETGRKVVFITETHINPSTIIMDERR